MHAEWLRRAIYIKKWNLCKQHYNRWKRYGDFDIQQSNGKCKLCGDPVSRNGKHGPVPDYCTKKCWKVAYYGRNGETIKAQIKARSEAQSQRLAEARRDKTCKQCGELFTPPLTNAQVFCSRPCNAKFHRETYSKRCSADGCTRPVRARGMCSMHYKRWGRSEGLIENPKWDDRRRDNYHRRRALKKMLPADDIRIADVFERDGWICSICDTPVEREIAWPDPMSPSLDHITPLSKGGHHVLENVALAHLECNVRKGDRVEADLVTTSPKG